MRRISFVIHVERSTAERNGAVVNNGAKLRSHLLSNETAKCRRLLTIEVGLQTVTDGFAHAQPRCSAATVGSFLRFRVQREMWEPDTNSVPDSVVLVFEDFLPLQKNVQ